MRQIISICSAPAGLYAVFASREHLSNLKLSSVLAFGVVEAGGPVAEGGETAVLPLVMKSASGELVFVDEDPAYLGVTVQDDKDTIKRMAQEAKDFLASISE